MPIPIDSAAVLSILASWRGRPVKAKEVGQALGLGADDRASVRAALRELEQEGKIVALEGRRYTLANEGSVLAGKIERKAGGSGWFVPDERRGHDAFLPERELATVIDGDRVLARLEDSPRGPIARIVKIVHRTRATVTGTFRRARRAAFVEVDGNLLSGPIVIPPGPEGNGDAVDDGYAVEVLLVEPPTLVTTAVGRIVRSLGRRGEIAVEVERILAEKGVTRAFPLEVEDEAREFPSEPSKEDSASRIDLRAMPLCTIDGETAKDFDDAVHGVRKGADVVVTVAIADVSHYVRAGKPLDVEGARRGTSIYYPGACIPMLPEALSNGLCSLKPNVDRLCMCVEMVVGKSGQVKKTRFFEGVMKSHARLTYTLVQRFLDDEQQARSAIPEAVRDSLLALTQAATALRLARIDRGSLDLDLPEAVIALDDNGEPVHIHPLERLFAHKLIEDLMVAANEAVARFFEESSWPSIFRIHEPPDEEKLGRYLMLVREVADPKRLPRMPREGKLDPKALSMIQDALSDHPARTTLDSLLLRAMMQARYAADNVGHYGLGSTAYLHFTSPIRRYPDLVVHRLLRDRLKRRKRKDTEDEIDALHGLLEDIAAQSSNCERKATDVERAIDALFAAWFMRDKIGVSYIGVVGGVTEFGAFVRLEELHVEGLVRLPDMPRDFYEFDEQRLQLRGRGTGRTISVGDKLPVKVSAVDLARRQVSFVYDSARPDDIEVARGPRKQRGKGAPDERRPSARDERGARGKRGPPPRPPRAESDHVRRAPVEQAAGAAPARRPLPRGPDELRALFEGPGTDRGVSRGPGEKPPAGRGGKDGVRGGKRPAGGKGSGPSGKGTAPGGKSAPAGKQKKSRTSSKGRSSDKPNKR